MTVKAGGDETNGAFTFLEWAAPWGLAPPPHRHDREDEAFYLIEGAIEVSCGDRQWEVGPGGFVFLPRGVPHSFVVSGLTWPSGKAGASRRRSARRGGRRPADRGVHRPAGRASRRSSRSTSPPGRATDLKMITDRPCQPVMLTVT